MNIEGRIHILNLQRNAGVAFTFEKFKIQTPSLILTEPSMCFIEVYQN